MKCQNVVHQADTIVNIAGGGTEITISGENLDKTASVTIGGVVCVEVPYVVLFNPVYDKDVDHVTLVISLVLMC